MFGISVFPGMGISIEENLQYIEQSTSRGSTVLFSSLHIPEADSSHLEVEFLQILKKSRECGLRTVVDISKGYYKRLVSHGYEDYILRLDFGFSLKEIVELSKIRPIQLNASTLDSTAFLALQRLGLRQEHLTVCHNYYPRIETGISIALLQERNQYFKGLDIEVSGFICGESIQRGPLFQGLPTVENHRHIDAIVSAQELYNNGCDIVLIGDSMGSQRDLKALQAINRAKASGITHLIPIKPLHTSQDMEKVLSLKHQERMDPAEYVVRSGEAKGVHNHIPAQDCIDRPSGSVTIDNYLYERYMGEIQITKRDLPADKRVNLLGYTTDKGRIVSRIKAGDSFSFYHVS